MQPDSPSGPTPHTALAPSYAATLGPTRQLIFSSIGSSYQQHPLILFQSVISRDCDHARWCFIVGLRELLDFPNASEKQVPAEDLDVVARAARYKAALEERRVVVGRKAAPAAKVRRSSGSHWEVTQRGLRSRGSDLTRQAWRYARRRLSMGALHDYG
ncbi:hypothetical protein BGY98DRAFT_1181274 [Russula aff. rugulosa BPL654]|nr:hypothetical protein BGY98DRAFT_1181274 [Russula aff. rugulosa BPL654]